MSSDVSAYRCDNTVTENGVFVICTTVGAFVADPCTYRD